MESNRKYLDYGKDLAARELLDQVYWLCIHHMGRWFYMHCMNMQMKTAVLVLVTLNVVFFHGMFCRKNRNTLVILVYYFCLMHRQLKKILRFI